MKEKKFYNLSLRHLIAFLIERFYPFPFHISAFQILVGIITPILLGAVLILSWMSFKKVKEITTENFNQQQLVLAQYAARQIEHNLDMLKKELSLLSLSPSIQYFEKVSIGKRMGITFSSIKDEGALEIRYMEALSNSAPYIESTGSQTHLMDSHGYQTVNTYPTYPEDMHYLKWARRKENKGNILMTEVFPIPPNPPLEKGGMGGFLIMKIVIPVWQVSVDETHPVATDRFSGVLLFVVDATELIEKVIRGIRSGKTGYAWVIDGNEIFLYHPEKDFIGKNAFEARKKRKPTISFARINDIQKKKMLAGQEGTSWYISGWHRGREGEMKKLIAYAPINVTNTTETPIWSVAVVAPISEVEEAIHSIHIRHLSLQAIIIFLILLGGVTVIYLMVSWSYTLKQEVEKKTIEFKKSEQRYKSLVENAEDIIFTVDYNGNYLTINKYGALFFNKIPEEIIRHNISEFLSWSSTEMLLMIQAVFKTKESIQITHPVGIGEYEYWFNTNLRRLVDKEGNIYAVLGISRDITDREKMEEQSYHTEKLASIGTLAAGVAHEINNPLAIILGFADLLVEKAKPGSQEYDILKTIEKHGLHAKKVVENLLSFARYTEQSEENVDINKNIDAVLSVVGNNLLLNKVTVKRAFSDELPFTRGNHQEMQQVFLNIINNAISAMKGGGTLTITTKTLDKNNIEIRFADTGHGIKKDYRSKIFDPLFTTKKVGEGTGLGLSVSYGIITKYGGTITFETKTAEESSGHGTAFIITLPAVKTVDKGDG